MVSQPQRHRTRHERHGGEMLTKAVMQLLSQPLLLAVAYRKDFSFETLAALDLAFQFFVCCVQLTCAVVHPLFEILLRSLQCNLGAFARSYVSVRFQNRTRLTALIAIERPATHQDDFAAVIAPVNEFAAPATITLKFLSDLLDRFGKFCAQ